MVLSWTDSLVPLADRPERPLGVDDRAGSPTCDMRDGAGERPRVDASGSAESERGVVGATADVGLTASDTGDGLAIRVGG